MTLLQRHDNPVLHFSFASPLDGSFQPRDARFALAGVNLDQGRERIDPNIPVGAGAGGGEFFGVEAFGDGAGLGGKFRFYRRALIKADEPKPQHPGGAYPWLIGCKWVQNWWMHAILDVIG